MKDDDTVRALARITDEGVFERLAMAVLREADPKYRSLVHPGVNAEGKTVKGPFDGITFIAGANHPHIVGAHHTICTRKDLEKKWLHDPRKSSGRRRSKSKTPAGDLIKTAAVIEAERARTPALLATLVLTTNREPPEDLVRDVHAAARDAGLTLDLWPCSRIAHFLDSTPQGQWLRREFLRIEQERLSKDLLRRLSQESVARHIPHDRPEAWVDRQLDKMLAEVTGREITFLVAESGLGKSVACYRRLSSHIAKGGYGLVLSHDIVAGAFTLNQAVDAALRQLHPTLVAGSGSEALALAPPDRPLLFVIEDINKSGHAAALVEKIVGWKPGHMEGTQQSSSQILCPVWPQFLATLSDEMRKRVSSLAVTGSSFTPAEGAVAIERRRQVVNAPPITRLEAETISSGLGHDPLLIALHDPISTQGAGSVVGDFIRSAISRTVARRKEHTATEYQQSLRALATVMLNHRRLDPGWTDIQSWIGSTGDPIAMLRHLTHDAEILRLVTSESEERLAFRHDRVREWLLVDAVAQLFRDGAERSSVLAEVHFAEVIGIALACSEVPPNIVEHIRANNPLALFHALRVFQEPQNDVHRAVLDAIAGWLGEEANHTRANRILRWEALQTLAETESNHVLPFVAQFRETWAWPALRARFRNGDIYGGIELCAQLELGVRVVGHLELIDHVVLRRGSDVISQLSNILRSPTLPARERSGSLRLAGHIADPALAESIEACWGRDSNRDQRLDDYLWACAECCGDEAARLLEPVCDTWAALPDAAPSENQSPPRFSLAAHNIRWAFQKKIPGRALAYFIERAKSAELKWPITHLLHALDHPDAVEFVVRYLRRH